MSKIDGAALWAALERVAREQFGADELSDLPADILFGPVLQAAQIEIGKYPSDHESLPKPIGEVDDQGRVLLPPGTDRDALLRDELRLARDWRLIREHDENILRRGEGRRSPHAADSASMEPPASFVTEWRTLIDAGFDYAKTILMSAYHEEQDLLWRREWIRNEHERKWRERQADERRQQAELDAYARYHTEQLSKHLRAPTRYEFPLTFQQWKARRNRETTASTPRR